MATALEATVIRITRPVTPQQSQPGHAPKLFLGADLHSGARWRGWRRGIGLLLHLVRVLLVFGLLARAARHELPAVAECRPQAGVGLLRGKRQRLLHRAAGILMIEELGRRRALLLADIGIALEVIGQRREADREVI